MRQYLLLLTTAVLLFKLSSSDVLSEEDSVCDSVVSCQSKFAEYQRKIEELKNKEKSLGNEIAFMDNQIGLTGAKIAEVSSRIMEKERELGELARDIADLEVRLDRVSRSLDFQRSLFARRANASYKGSRVSTLELLLGSGSFSDFIIKLKYSKVLELQDQKLLKQMEDTRKNFTSQKVIVRDKKEKVAVVKAAIETEKKNLESYKSSLNLTRKEKQMLLSVTQNDEAKYRSLLTKALAEKEAFARAIAGLELKDGKTIKRSEVIAIMGNSGSPYCSTGSHLHLEVRQNGQAVNPADFLGSHDVTYEEGVESMNFRGDWSWPLSDPVVISQEYGMSFWAKRGFYGGSPHTGIDMYNNADTVITALADGTLYRGSTICGKSVLKYAAIDHGNGLFSYYFHIQ